MTSYTLSIYSLYDEYNTDLRDVVLSSLGFDFFNSDGVFLLECGDDDDKVLLSNDGWDFVSVGIGVLLSWNL